MERRKRMQWGAAAGLLAAFILWTGAVRCVDVRAIGPNGSAVGFAAFNAAVHRLTGVHWRWYVLTDALSVIPLGIAAGFALLGLAQLIRRKSIRRVDRSILMLGGFYAAVLAVYVLFEVCPVNYRPVLVEGALEASYPSSTTMLAMCVLLTAAMQLCSRISHITIRHAACAALAVLTVFMVAARLISGVHWATDIVGGGLLSAGLVTAYGAACGAD